MSSPYLVSLDVLPRHAWPVSSAQDFRKIATHLRGRTTGDCIKYYYRNQKADEFAAVRRKQQLKKRRMLNSEKGRQYMGGRAGQPKAGAPPLQGAGCLELRVQGRAGLGSRLACRSLRAAALSQVV